MRVLLVTNITGAGAQNGEALVPAANYSVKQLNAAGGVLGCPIALDIKDEASDPTKDLPLVQQALSNHNYSNVIVGDFGAASTLPYLTRQKVLNISEFGAGLADPKVYPYFFDVVPPLAVSTAYAVKQSINDRHKKIAAIVQNNNLGDSSTKGIKSAASTYGGQVVDVERVDPTAVNTTPAVTRAKNAGADALIIDVAGAVTSHLLNDIQTAGWQVPTYGGLAVFATNIAGLVPKKAYENLVVVGSAVATTPSRPVVNQFIAGLKGTAALKTNLLQPANVHDDLYLFAWAANQSKSLDPGTVTRYLEDHGMDPVPGLLMAESPGYSSNSHELSGPNSIASAKAGPFVNGQLKRVAFLK